VHATHDVDAVKPAPPEEKRPTGHGVPAAEPAGQKDPAGHVACVLLVVAAAHT
jgi:hypothetical protein